VLSGSGTRGRANRFSTGVVRWLGLATALVGFAYLTAPRALAPLTGIDLSSSEAVTDFRATYGGLQLGLGAFLMWCSTRRLIEPAIVLAGVVATCMVTGRVVGFLVDGKPTPLLLAAAGLEGGISLMCFLIVVRARFRG
jgi:hypothetical protein